MPLDGVKGQKRDVWPFLQKEQKKSGFENGLGWVVYEFLT